MSPKREKIPESCPDRGNLIPKMTICISFVCLWGLVSVSLRPLYSVERVEMSGLSWLLFTPNLARTLVFWHDSTLLQMSSILPHCEELGFPGEQLSVIGWCFRGWSVGSFRRPLQSSSEPSQPGGCPWRVALLPASVSVSLCPELWQRCEGREAISKGKFTRCKTGGTHRRSKFLLL